MLNIYPANRLENLAILLSKVIESDDSALFEPSLIVTQSQGMKHWLHMQLAEQNGISMNLDFQLPVQFFWRQLRTILGNENIPEKSAFSREVLCWKIYDFLAEEDFVSDPQCEQPTAYWTANGKESTQKRFQLARQQADLFEQYMIYRPDWLERWITGDYTEQEAWQAKLWFKVIALEPNHTSKLLRKALPQIKEHKHKLPSSICVFGLNTLAPIWLEFLNEIAEHTQVHVFHLNPCVEYWGELQSEKQLAKWLATVSADDETFTGAGDIGNPLLANYGMQGKEFLSLLPEYAINEIPVFTPPSDYESETSKTSALHTLQEDILNLHDGRETPTELIDNSIVISSAHSALREIQGLHDFILHKLQQDKSLTPKDIVVMCPHIEDYAPYVEAVFNQPIGDSEQLIPCSISDRTLKNVEPIVEIFEQLLQLPDSRFQLSEIISYLKLPAIAHKFSIAESEVNIIEQWLQTACVHWGLNEPHKASIIKNASGLSEDDKLDTNDKFTWQQGIDRLMLGFAMSDHAVIHNDELLLPTIEGDQSLLLGKLLMLLEQLSEHAANLNTDRTPSQWHSYLISLKDDIFALTKETQFGVDIVSHAIDEFALNTQEASFETSISLRVVRDYLSNFFSQPEPGHQFMSGKVTFCSMVPMRSIPFKVVCILGMNDGDFPRFDKPFSFDLIAKNKARKGDRSRRGDDRYLFLEALISARDTLYMSYQGNSVKDNSEREPSIILRELMDYLSRALGWTFDENDQSLIHKLPLQPFSEANYTGRYQSFDSKWFTLNQSVRLNNQDIQLDAPAIETLTAEELIQFFADPIKAFSRTQFNLYGERISDVYQDSEPFETSKLDQYKLQHQYVDAMLASKSTNSTSNNAVSTAHITQAALLSNQLPDSKTTVDELSHWEAQATEFAETLSRFVFGEPYKVEVIANDITIYAELPLVSDGANLDIQENSRCQVFSRMATPKGKDYLKLWVYHLIANTEQPTMTKGLFYNEKSIKERIKEVTFAPIIGEIAVAQIGKLLTHYQLGMSQPMFAPVNLAAEYFQVDRSGKKKLYGNQQFELSWYTSRNIRGYDADPLARFYFEQKPDFDSDIAPLIESIYRPMFEVIFPTLAQQDFDSE